MALSSCATTYQLGIDYHAAAAFTWPKIAPFAGFCAACITRVCRPGRSAAKIGRYFSAER